MGKYFFKRQMLLWIILEEINVVQLHKFFAWQFEHFLLLIFLILNKNVSIVTKKG
jgi:hypothetical protein